MCRPCSWCESKYTSAQFQITTPLNDHVCVFNQGVAYRYEISCKVTPPVITAKFISIDLLSLKYTHSSLNHVWSGSCSEVWLRLRAVLRGKRQYSFGNGACSAIVPGSRLAKVWSPPVCVKFIFRPIDMNSAVIIIRLTLGPPLSGAQVKKTVALPCLPCKHSTVGTRNARQAPGMVR